MHSGVRGQGKGFRVKPSAAIGFRRAILQPVQRLPGLLTPLSKTEQKNRKYQANSNDEQDCRLRAETAPEIQDSEVGMREKIRVGNTGKQACSSPGLSFLNPEPWPLSPAPTWP
jgi:hypothetical protein